jgi:hypothetical protein
MAQLDKIHEAVKNALIKDGWTITAENFQLRYKELKLYGDIEAQKILAEKGSRKIVVEVKSFLGVSIISEFQKALGQYRIYEGVLSKIKPEAKIYLAFSIPPTINFSSVKASGLYLKEKLCHIL